MNRNRIPGMTDTSRQRYNYNYQPGSNVIPRQSFVNDNNLVHNNVGENVMTEQLETFPILINGYDRDTSAYTNPYSFPIHFGGAGTGQYMSKDGIKVYQGTTGVNIERNFKNVKFIKITNIVIPRYNLITYDFDNTQFIYGVTGGGSNNDYDGKLLNRFVVLKIKELEDNKKYSSGSFFKSDFMNFRHDRDAGGNHMFFVPITNDTVSFKNSLLKNLNKLTIKLYDDKDTLLTSPTLKYTDKSDDDNSVTREFKSDLIVTELQQIITNIGLDDGNTVNPFTGSDGDISDINATIDQINALKLRHQIIINMDIGIVTNSVNTQTKFGF